MKRRTLVLIILVAAVAMFIALYAVPPPVIVSGPSAPLISTKTTGVVKSVREPGWFSSSQLQRATILLADGSLVEASVLPGCVVRSGESVRVHVLGAAGAEEPAYLVAGPT